MSISAVNSANHLGSLSIATPSPEQARSLSGKTSPEIGKIGEGSLVNLGKGNVSEVPDFDQDRYYYRNGELVELKRRYVFDVNGLDKSSSMSDILDQAQKYYDEIQASVDSDEVRKLKLAGLDESVSHAFENFIMERTIRAFNEAYPLREGKSYPERDAAFNKMNDGMAENAKKMASAFLDMFKMQQLLRDAQMTDMLGENAGSRNGMDIKSFLDTMDDFLNNMGHTSLNEAARKTTSYSKDYQKSLGAKLEQIWAQMKTESDAGSGIAIYDKNGIVISS
jgi:hypothetical protein